MTTYTPEQGDIIAAGSLPATELFSRVGGFIAGCGQAALAVLLNAANGQGTSPQTITALIRESINQHLVFGTKASSGETSPSDLIQLGARHGVTIQSEPWQVALAQNAGTRDVILGLSNASALGGNDSNVAGHYITVVGIRADGTYIVSDPNSTESTQGKFVTYSQNQLNAAQPFWAGVSMTSAQQGGCVKPILYNYPGGASSPEWLSALQAYNDCTAAAGPANPLAGAGDVLGSIAGSLKGMLDAISRFFSLDTLMRGVKLALGVGLIFLALVLAFLPDIGAAALTAGGQPEAGAAILGARGGPKGLARSGIRAGGSALGRQRAVSLKTREKEARIQQQANVRAQAFYPEDVREAAQRAATTRRLTPPITTQRAQRAQRAPATPQFGTPSTGPLSTPSTPSTPTNPNTSGNAPRKPGFGPLHFNTKQSSAQMHAANAANRAAKKAASSPPAATPAPTPARRIPVLTEKPMTPIAQEHRLAPIPSSEEAMRRETLPVTEEERTRNPQDTERMLKQLRENERGGKKRRESNASWRARFQAAADELTQAAKARMARKQGGKKP